MKTSALFFSLSLGLLSASPDFVRDIQPLLESHCIRCHGESKGKGGLRMHTRAALLEGGDDELAINEKDPTKSYLLTVVRHPADHDDIMPPQTKKGGPPLSAAQITLLEKWITEGTPWPQDVTLKHRDPAAVVIDHSQPDPTLARLEVFPKSITLETAADFHRFIVIAHHHDATTSDVTPHVVTQIADPSLLRLEGTTARPLADGETTIKITYRDQELTFPAIVKEAQKQRPISFQRDVMPVLTSAGCNTGSCHGSARGQDGFNLSLFGYDSAGDHHRITHELPGRRINLAIPEESLLLTKSIEAVPHTGGKRFSKDSEAYRVIYEWLKSGAAYDDKETVLATSIEVSPPQAVLAGSRQTLPLSVRALYSDGTDRDVTSLTSYTTSNDNSVLIDPAKGIMTSAKRGEAFLMGRFQTFTAGMQTIVVPTENTYEQPKLKAHNYIDTHIHEKLHKLRIIPSELCSDAAFVRRVHLDLIGRLPSNEELAAFLEKTDPQKRSALVDQLLATPEFTELWVMKWAELLQIRTFVNQVSYKSALLYYNWLKDRLSAGVPFNEVTREILTSTGGTFSSPATNFFQVELETKKLTENIAQVFMGTRIQCAQCHNHPFDRWTMDDYYSFASFFTEVKRKPAEDRREQIIFDGKGEIKHPVTKKNALAKYLGGEQPDAEDKRKRREQVATWLTSGENPWFARNLANITWAHFFGIGIVDPVDDVRISNPPSNPALLDDLAKRLVSYEFDLKKLVKDICNSRTYQLATQTNATNESDNTNFSHARIRRLRAEILLDVISQVTDTRVKFKGLPLGARAVQIADGNTSTYFLKTFGRATRETVCSCEVKMEPNLSQALHLLNGDSTHKRIQDGKVIPKLKEAGKSDDQIIEHLYLRCLSRPVLPKEKEKLQGYLAKAADEKQKQEVLEDLFWALLNSKEFIFNH